MSQYSIPLSQYLNFSSGNLAAFTKVAKSIAVIPVLLLALLSLTALEAQTNYTILQCLEGSDAHQPIAKQKPLIEAAHRAAVAQLRANLLPQASLNGQATWQSDVTELPIKLPNFEVPAISRDQYRLTLELTQSLWDGGQIARQTELMEAQTKIEQQRIQIDRYSAREQVISLYCATLLAQKQTEALLAAQKDVQAKIGRLTEQIKNGTAIPSASYGFEARQLELEQQTEEAQAHKRAAIEGLSLLTGLPIRIEDVLATTTAAENNSTAERPELQLFSLQQQSTLAQEQLARIKSMPRLNAIATLGYARPGLNFLSNEFEPYAIVGVNMRWNLSAFYSGSITKERQQYRLQSERVAAQREQFLLQTTVRQRQVEQDLVRLRTALQKDQNIIGLREKVAATAAVQLENGLLTPSEYLTETTQITTARLYTAIHEIQLLQATLQLAFLQGKL